MPRHYTDLERRLVLQCLVANGCDVPLTCTQTGIPENTIRRWRNKYLPPTPSHFQGRPSLTMPPPFPPLPGNDLQAFRDIKRQLLDKVNRLSYSLDDAIEDASLIQRAAALAQLIDRVIKISGQLPPEDYLLEDELEDEQEDEYHAETQHSAPSRQTVGHHQE